MLVIKVKNVLHTLQMKQLASTHKVYPAVHPADLQVPLRGH